MSFTSNESDVKWKKGLWFLRRANKLRRLDRAFAKFFERSAERFAVLLCFRLLTDQQGKAVYGFGELFGEVDKNSQRIGMQLPNRARVLRALEFFDLSSDARGYSDDS